MMRGSDGPTKVGRRPAPAPSVRLVSAVRLDTILLRASHQSPIVRSLNQRGQIFGRIKHEAAAMEPDRRAGTRRCVGVAGNRAGQAGAAEILALGAAD